MYTDFYLFFAVQFLVVFSIWLIIDLFVLFPILCWLHVVFSSAQSIASSSLIILFSPLDVDILSLLVSWKVFFSPTKHDKVFLGTVV